MGVSCLRFPYPCNRCSGIPPRFRCSSSYCSECPVFVEFFFNFSAVQLSFFDYVPKKPLSFWEYELASLAKEREDLLNE